MRFYISFLIFCSLSLNIFGQNDSIIKKINLLSQVSNIPFDSCLLAEHDCGDDIIWEVVKFGKNAIEPLIDKILDTSYSNFYFPDSYSFVKETRLRTGDIAYITLSEIISFHDLPRNGDFDVEICGGYKTDLFLFYLPDYRYRLDFQKAIRHEYREKKLI